MGDTSAKPEFCTHCGQRLGIERRIIVGSTAVLHPECVDRWKYDRAVREAWREPDAAGSAP